MRNISKYILFLRINCEHATNNVQLKQEFNVFCCISFYTFEICLLLKPERHTTSTIAPGKRMAPAWCTWLPCLLSVICPVHTQGELLLVSYMDKFILTIWCMSRLTYGYGRHYMRCFEYFNHGTCTPLVKCRLEKNIICGLPLERNVLVYEKQNRCIINLSFDIFNKNNHKYSRCKSWNGAPVLYWRSTHRFLTGYKHVNMIINYFRFPYLHVSNSALFST